MNPIHTSSVSCGRGHVVYERRRKSGRSRCVHAQGTVTPRSFLGKGNVPLTSIGANIALGPVESATAVLVVRPCTISESRIDRIPSNTH
ncbi:hypothetical protein L3X38_001162 [Prunus dulcis]|uniref:Uncharacterized protein n=1 Tax=Prunus dulcis TaxID=3755 RepID=A0AAD4WRJ7_PRUDU|nr:hypothetical protein L3X38_001162 [Prunus dulcis]